MPSNNEFVDSLIGRPVISADGETMGSYAVKTYTAGDEVSLMCMADGSPTPEYRWYRTLPQGDFEEVRAGGNIQLDDGTLR